MQEHEFSSISEHYEHLKKKIENYISSEIEVCNSHIENATEEEKSNVTQERESDDFPF